MNLAAFPAAQQPPWPDPAALARVIGDLTMAPPLVPADECDQMRARLAAVARGEAFLLQGGDCAETFAGVSAEAVSAKLRTLMQMAVVLTFATGLPVVKVGRLAGQYSKPRSRLTETRGGVTLHSYRGDSVNSAEFTPAARTPDPERLRRMYQASSSTLDLVRAFATGGQADLHMVHAWNTDFVRLSPAGRRYERLAGEIGAALNFVQACGVAPEAFRTADFFVSHEALLLDYEAALTRRDRRTGQLYDLAAHLLWIGERTRQPDGAHVEFASRIANPVAVKLGPAVDSDEALRLIDRLDPDREPGRLTFITRMGASRIRDLLPTLIEKVTASGAQVVWICDPMHGNTFEAPTGHKTRDFGEIADEVRGFFEVHYALGTHPGGIHIEFTGDDVTECVGGGVMFTDLAERYETACDPRLNRSQSLYLAFLMADMIKTHLATSTSAGTRPEWPSRLLAG